MDVEIDDSPSALQQYLRFTTTRNRFEPDHNLFTFPLLRPLKYNCSYHRNQINISSRAANTHLIQNLI